jgi:hypothetical protein
MFSIRNGLKQDALSPLLFNFVLEYAIRKVQAINDDLKLNGTHKLAFYADDVIILGGNMHIIKEKAEVLLGASMEIGLEVRCNC